MKHCANFNEQCISHRYRYSIPPPLSPPSPSNSHIAVHLGCKTLATRSKTSMRTWTRVADQTLWGVWGGDRRRGIATRHATKCFLAWRYKRTRAKCYLRPRRVLKGACEHTAAIARVGAVRSVRACVPKVTCRTMCSACTGCVTPKGNGSPAGMWWLCIMCCHVCR